jgi:hypothetical protein
MTLPKYYAMASRKDKTNLVNPIIGAHSLTQAFKTTNIE